ncbi:hypothetical protein Tco_0419398 [Tanacetum coccineum]
MPLPYVTQLPQEQPEKFSNKTSKSTSSFTYENLYSSIIVHLSSLYEVNRSTYCTLGGGESEYECSIVEIEERDYIQNGLVIMKSYLAAGSNDVFKAIRYKQAMKQQERCELSVWRVKKKWVIVVEKVNRSVLLLK